MYVIACAVCWVFLVIETHAVQFAQVTLLAQISLENAIVAIGNGTCICTRIRSTHIHPGVNPPRPRQGNGGRILTAV